MVGSVREVLLSPLLCKTKQRVEMKPNLTTDIELDTKPILNL